MTLGNKIRSRREELRLTQPELAEKADVAQSFISRAERDVFKTISSDTAVRLAAALDMSLDDLLINEGRVS